MKKSEIKNVQIENNRVEENERQIMNFSFTNCMFKENFGKVITKVFYVWFCILRMMGKILKEQVIKSWDVFFIMLILKMFLIQELKTKRYYQTYGITALKKHVDVNHSIIAKKNLKKRLIIEW